MPQKIAVAILSLLLCCPVAQAQDTKPADTARRDKALELLKSLADQIPSLQSPENRARMGANIAESLWKHDEKLARSLFSNVADNINAGFQNCDLKEAADQLTVRVFLKLRADTVQRIAKYDPELAVSFLSATKPQAEDIRRMFPDDEQNFEAQLAKQIAGVNPDIALKLGRQSLARGFSSSGDLLAALRQLHRKHRDKGVMLYKEAVQKLRDKDLAAEWEAMNFASALLLSLAPPVADESAFRDLVSVIINAALANGCDKKPKTDAELNPFCDEVEPLVSTMAQVDPARAHKLQHFTVEISEEDFPPLQSGYEELQEVAADGTVEEILALAEKYPPIEVPVYTRAMIKAYESGDLERARKIANSVREPRSREQLLAQLERATSQMEISDEQLAQAEKLLESIQPNRDRIQFMHELADSVRGKNKKMALKLLDQALELVDGIKAPAERIETRLSLATSYCAQGSDRGLDIVQSEIPKLNELVDAAVKLDGFDTTYLRDGEWNMSANGSIGSILTVLAQSTGYFAACDPDRALSLTAQFERPEIRMMAQLKLAQGILAGPPPRKVVPLFRMID